MPTPRDPWLAANLSWSVAGLGQLYAGRKRAGFLFLCVEVLLWTGWVAWVVSPGISTTTLVGLLGSQVALWIVAAWAAFRTVKADPNFQPPPKSPWKSLFLTRFILGTGHLYGRRWIRGVLLLGVLGFYSLWSPPERFALWLFIGYLLLRSLGLLDSFLILRRENVAPLRFSVAVLVLVLVGSQMWLASWLIKTWVVELYKIPSSGMEPTLLGEVSENHSRNGCPFAAYHESASGDRIVVSKSAYFFSPIRRFDVAVFKYPLEQSKNFVKRVIGLPNEELRLRGGDVYVRAKGETRFRIARKPLEVQQGIWIRQEGEADDAFDLASLRARWALDEVEFSKGLWGGVVWPTGSKMGWIHLRTPVEDGWGNSVRDLRLAFELRAPGEKDEIQVRIRNGHGDFDLKLSTQSKGELRLRKSGKDVAVVPLGSLPRNCWCRVELLVFDGQALVLKDSEVMGQFAFIEFLEDDAGAPDASGELSLGASGLAIRRLQVGRDFHYLGKPNRDLAWNGEEPLAIPDGQYFVMGDNVANSHDSRAWVKRTFQLKDGRTIVCEAQQLNYGSGLAGRRLQEKLRLSQLPDISIMGDQNGDDVAIFQDQIVSETSEYAPFVDRTFFVGRVVKTWWPLARQGPVR